jgi:cytochrome P450
MRVIAGVLGVPESDMGAFKRWSDDWLLLISQRGTMEELVTAAKGVTDFQRYIHGFIEQQRLNPCDDLMGDLVRAVAEMDEPPTTNALVGVIMTILFAGHETTTTLIGNTVRLLLQHPDQLEAVSADPTLLPSAVTEVLRYDPPVPGMYRTTTKDVEIGGVWLPAGSHLQLAYASANRDEDVFDEPDRFDIHRAKDQPILSFGRGIHFCLGANLAQTEVREVVAQLLESLPGLRFMPGHEMRPVQSATVRGNAEIWLEWDVADAGAPSS